MKSKGNQVSNDSYPYPITIGTQAQWFGNVSHKGH